MDSLALGYSGSGNILFQWQIRFFLKGNKRIPERRSCVTVTVVSPIFPYPTYLPLDRGLAYSAVFPPTLKLHCQGKVLGFVAMVVTLHHNCPTPIIFLNWIVSIQTVLGFINKILYSCMWLQFLDVETNPGQQGLVPGVCIILCSNL